MKWIRQKLIDWKLRYITFRFTEMSRKESGRLKLMSFQTRGRFAKAYWSDYFSVPVAEVLIMSIQTSQPGEGITLYMECYHPKVVANGFSKKVNLFLPAWVKAELMPELKKFVGDKG